MREGNYPRLTLLAGMLLCLVLSGCQLTRGSQAETGTGLRITLGETYAGVRDGNVESAPLPTGSAYVTVEACVENRSAMERSIGWGGCLFSDRRERTGLPGGAGVRPGRSI